MKESSSQLFQKIPAVAFVLMMWLLVLLPACKPKPVPEDRFTPGNTDSLTVKVIRYASNRVRDIDRFYVQSGKDSFFIFFPPHTATFIIKAAPAGTNIQVSVKNAPQPLSEMIEGDPYNLIALKAGAGSLPLFIPAIKHPPHKPGTDNVIRIDTDEFSFLKDKASVPTAVVTKNYLVELKPAVAEKYGSMLSSITHFSCTASLRDTADGFVNELHLPVAVPLIIVVNGKQFLVQ